MRSDRCACAQAIQGMKLLCTELARLERPDPAQPGQAVPVADMSPATTRLLRDNACDLVLDLCQKLHQVPAVCLLHLPALAVNLPR